MRINFYRFPETVDVYTRVKEGCDILKAHCELKGHCTHCKNHEGPVTECSHFIVDDADDIIEGITVTTVKNLMKKYGGAGGTSHYERDGSLFEVTPINSKGNNSKFKYNIHL